MKLTRNILIITCVFLFIQGSKAQNKENYLSNLCKVWGVLKYYHPAIQKGKLDWDTILINYIPKVESVKNNLEYNNIISELITEPKEVHKLKRPYQYLPKDTTVNNFNFEWIEDENILNKENQERLFEVIENYKPQKNIYNKKELNVYYLNTNLNKYFYKNNYNPDKAHALLSLFRYWNIIQYYYPHKKTNSINWNHVLDKYIPIVISSSGKNEFYDVMVHLFNETQSCHSFFTSYNWRNNYYYPPITLKYIENKTIVTDIADTLSKITSLVKGDIIDSINHKPTDSIRKMVRYCSSCPDNYIAEQRTGLDLLRVKPEDSLTLSVTDNFNNSKTIILKLNKNLFPYFNDYYERQQPKKNNNADSLFKIYPDKIAYLDMNLFSDKNLRNALSKLLDCKTWILDCRSYPKYFPYSITRYISNKRKPFGIAYKPNYKYPGLFSYDLQKTSRVMYLGKKFKGNIIILLDGNTQSAAEWQIMHIQALTKPLLIGSNTAGADGGAVSILLQNNILTYFTGTAVFYPNGKATERIGIQPDIFVTPTIKGIKENRDEIIEKALMEAKKITNNNK